jgi:hypothetical protein
MCLAFATSSPPPSRPTSPVPLRDATAELAADPAELADLAADPAELAADPAELADLAADPAELAADPAELAELAADPAELAADPAELAELAADPAELAADRTTTELASSKSLERFLDNLLERPPHSSVLPLAINMPLAWASPSGRTSPSP